MATDDAVVESPYSDHLRSSSYALLRPPPGQQPVIPPTPPSGPQSMLLPSVIASRFSTSGMAYSGGQQSMPYVSASMLIEGNPQNRMLPKTPRTCELEEYARRYEAMQRGNASRRRISQAHADPSAPPTNRFDRLARLPRISHYPHFNFLSTFSVPAGGVNFWQKRPSLQHEPHYMRSSSGVWGSAAPSVVTSTASGRDSVATVLTNSSSETVKYQDLVMAEQALNEQQNHYQNTQQLQAYLHQQQQHQQQQMEYASLPPEPRVQKDLKKFPLHTYPSLSTIGDEAEYAAASANKENAKTNGSSPSSSSSSGSSAVYARPHKMRHQMSERSMMAATPESLHHSKSVPNLIPVDEPPTPEVMTPTATPSEASFSFLDPDKRMRVTDNTLKLIQKQALLDYYERHSTTPGGGGGRRKSAAAAAGSEHPDSGFYSPTERAKQHQLANVEVHRAADHKQVGNDGRKTEQGIKHLSIRGVTQLEV